MVSDTWYRAPLALPPYEDGFGNLWAMDGTCVNAVHMCEPPSWYLEMSRIGLIAEFRFEFARMAREMSWLLPDGWALEWDDTPL